MPATVDALKIFLGLDPASTQDEIAMGNAVAAANAQATTWRPDVTRDASGAELATWPANIDAGAVLYAARYYGRRGSVAGVAGFADLGISAIPRLDPDVRALWELGEFQSSVIA